MLRLLTISAAVVFSALLSAAEPVECDIVLQNGTILDGSGEGAFIGAVGIKGARIVGVGEFEAGGQPLVIDCSGLIVCPLHRPAQHSDSQIVQAATRANLNFHAGLQTVVTGTAGSDQPTSARSTSRSMSARRHQRGAPDPQVLREG